MEPNAAIESAPILYTSRHRHEVDEKRRVQIPAKWRPAKPGIELTVVVWPKDKDGPCLRVLPPEQMAALLREIAAMPSSDPNKTVLKRIIGGESAQLTLDKVGRICLPEEMATAAGITDKAVLVGLLDRFEIWSPERFERVRAADQFMTPEAFSRME